MKRESYILILTLLALTACSDKPNDEPSDLVSLDLLTPVIVAENESRQKPVEGTFFPYIGLTQYYVAPGNNVYLNWEVSMFVCEKGSFNPHLTGSNNRRTIVRTNYLYSSSTGTWNKSWSWFDGTPQARIGHDIDIYAYYPRVDKTFDPDAVPFTVSQTDWMWADPVTINNVSTENKTVPLKFHHAMTCIEVRLSTLYTSSIDLSQITLTDAKKELVSSGTMDIRDGSLTCTPNQQKITITSYGGSERLPIYNDVNSSYRSFCFIMPQKEFSAGDLKLTFFYDRSSTWPYPSVQSRADFTIPTTFTNSEGTSVSVKKFETGKRYILNLMIDNTDLIVPLDFVVDDWVTNDVNLKI